MKSFLFALTFIFLVNGLTGQILDSVHLLKISETGWKPYLKLHHETNENDSIIQTLSLCPENDTTWGETIWANHVLNTFAYNDNNQLSEQVTRDWFAQAWRNLFRTLHFYDSTGNLSVSIREIWNGLTWEGIVRTTRTYDSSNRIITSVDEKVVEGNWVEKSWIEFTYGPNGLLETQYTLYHVTGGIYDESNVVLTYNSQNQLILITVQEPLGPTGSGIWGDIGRTMIVYENSTITRTFQRYLQDTWTNNSQDVKVYENEKLKISIRKEWEEDSLIWISKDSSYYFYSTPTGIENVISDESFLVYPNPATTYLNINVSNSAFEEGHFLLFSHQGQKLLEGNISGANMFLYLEKYIPGMYYLVIEKNDVRGVQRFIKQ